MTEPITLHSAFLRIHAERTRQDQLHPRDNWPIHHDAGSAATARRRDLCQLENDSREKFGDLTWAALLNEELAEACAETTPHAQADELLQLAALAIRAACAITRRTT